MATTSPDNIKSPDSGDQYALVQDMGALADTVQNALVRRANLYKGTSAQRTAFTTATEGTWWQDTNGNKDVWVRKAGAWVIAVPTPVKSASGTGSASVGSSATNITVNFPSGRFSAAPGVSVLSNSPSSVGSRVYFRVTSVSSSQMTIEATFLSGATGTWAYRWSAVGE